MNSQLSAVHVGGALTRLGVHQSHHNLEKKGGGGELQQESMLH